MQRTMPKTIVLCCLYLAACEVSQMKSTIESVEEEAISQPISPVTEVTIAKVEKGIFKNELYFNGTIKSRFRVDLVSKSDGVITKISVANGDKVAKGEELVTIENFELENKIKEVKNKIEKARLDRQSILIDMGFSGLSPDTIPLDKNEIATIKSGIRGFEIELEGLEQQLAQSVVRSPIDGVVANLHAQVFNRADGYKTLCTIIDDNKMLVEFKILESQLDQLLIGHRLEIRPASTEKRYAGRLVEINPVVNENGLITLKGEILDPDRLLLDGMQADVWMSVDLSDQLIIPKEGIVTRQGKDVVFAYEDGKAIWKYVEKGIENFEKATILSGLEEGEEIITQGNINLGHLANVKRR